MLDMIERLPKANQHLHLTGALSLDYIRGVVEAQSTEYEPLEEIGFDHPGIWTLAKLATSTTLGFLGAMTHVVDREAEDNVRLVELTFNPYGMLRRGMSNEGIAEAVVDAVAYAQSKDIALLVRPGVNRKDGPLSVPVVRDVYLNIDEKYRWGIDLNGDERRFPTEPFIDAFSGLSREGIATSIHAGEFADLDKSLCDALKAHPVRLGHAVAAANDNALVAQISTEGIAVEVALTSNLRRGAVASLDAHPVGVFLQHDIDVVFGTDDPTFFGNTMSDEFHLLAEYGMGSVTIEKLATKGLTERMM